MTDAVRLAQNLIRPIARAVLADRRNRANRSLPPAKLINMTVTDDYKRRKIGREVEAMCDTVAERLEGSTVHVPDRGTARWWRQVPGQAAKIHVFGRRR